jgi:hypothetical protein
MRNLLDYIRQDWQSNPVRFTVEALCWFNNLGIALLVNLTVPDLPYMWLYPMWISCSAAYAWCAYTRKSSGMMATFIMFAVIDSLGFIKYITL